MDTANEGACEQYIKKIMVLHPSKKSFCKEYKKICKEEDIVKFFYLCMLKETEEAIRLGNIDRFKNACKIIEYINGIENVTQLRAAFEHKNNPIIESNVIILTCKHNRCHILQRIFHSDNKILINLSVDIGRDELKPTDRDVTGRTAFYYAIRENNVDLLDTLWNDWPSTYLNDPTHLQELDDIISNAYAELKLRNVLLSEEIQFYVEYRLVDIRFFYDTRNNAQRRDVRPDLSSVLERIDLVIKCNELLQTEYSGEKEVDDQFIYVAGFVAQNIDVLKRQIKRTYDRLPWEEIEFCLICFIMGHKNHDFTSMIYRTVLEKTTMLEHLANFVNKLGEIKHNIKETDVNSNIPAIRRDDVVKNIVLNNDSFKTLYEHFEEVRNVYSINKIVTYIELALSSDPRNTKGQLIIERALLVTGEYLKNTLESPNLSHGVSEILLCSGLQKDTLLILRSIRNLLSHSHSLKNRMEAVKGNNSNNVFSIIQNDLKKIMKEVSDILLEIKLNTIKKIMTRILEMDNIDEIIKLINIFKYSGLNEMDFISNNKSSEHVTVEKLVKELKSKIKNKTFQQDKLFQEINFIIDKGENNMQSSREMFNLGFSWLTVINKSDFYDRDIESIKFAIKNLLKNMTPKMNNDDVTRIAYLSTKLYKNIKSTSKQDQREKLINKLSRDLRNVGELSLSILDDPSVKGHDDFEEISGLIQKIIHYSSFQANKVKGLEVIKIKYEEKPEKFAIVNNNKEHSLNERMQTLNSVLSFNEYEPKKILKQFNSYDKDISLQVATEGLILDIMEIMNNCLSNNLLLFDTKCPILLGKCLRNHLAHGNAIVDIFPYNSTRSVLSNAIKLIRERHTSIIRNDTFIGQPIMNNPHNLKKSFDHNLRLIKIQEEMLKALKEGNFVQMQKFISAGAEIKSRNSNNMSTLHIAACGGNTEIIRFLLDNGLDIESKDINDQNLLFMAVNNGKIDIVKYLIEKKGFPIEKVDKKGKTILHIAAKNGHKDIIEYLLSKNANVAVKDTLGYSPIHFAVIYNHKDAVVSLLQKEPSVDFNEVSGGFTLLHVAAEQNCLDIVNFLIENNANVNALNDNRWIPLHGAAFKGHCKVVKALLLKGSDVNIKSVDGCTPLYYAIENGSEEVVKMLLEFGKKSVNFNENLNSVLPFACYLGNENIVKLLLEYDIYLNQTDAKGRTPLHHAAEMGHHNVIDMLIKRNANVNYESSDGATPLNLAIQGNHGKAAEVLLQNGSNVNYISGDKKVSPLHLAAFHGNESIMDLLIKKGAKINSSNIDGYTPLILATKLGHTNCVRTLIKYGAEYRNNVSLDFSPIHTAALNGNADIVEIFLKQNVDVNITANMKEGKITPLHCAAMNGNLDTVKILVENGAEIDITPLHLAVESGNNEIFKYMFEKKNNLGPTMSSAPYVHSAVRQSNKVLLEFLLENGVKLSVENISTAILTGDPNILETILKHDYFDLNAMHQDNITFITVAAMSGNKNIVETLLNYGADVNKGGKIYPLHIAAYCNNVDVALVLLKNGARVNVESEEASTPLHIASGSGHTNMVEILLKYGADIEIKDFKNRTALELAIANKHFFVVKTLFQGFKGDINAKGNDDWSLLHIAAQAGDCDIGKYLISKGADVNSKNSSGSKPIHIAAREGHTNLVDLFLGEGLSLYDTGAANQTLLHYATIKNHLEVIKFLIQKSFVVNVKDANGSTSLHLAAQFGFRDVAQFLLNNSAIYNAIDKFNRTPLEMTANTHIKNMLQSTKNLFECVKQNKYTEVETHIRNGACVKAKNTGDITTLHFAAWKGYNETVISLLNNNADPNIRGKNCYSCLHYAVKFSHIDVVKSLLSNGAIYNAEDHNGRTPIYFAENSSIADLLKLIGECFTKVENGNSQVINMLKIIKDVDTIKSIMNAQNKNGQSLIVVAVLNNHPMLKPLTEICQEDVSSQIEMAELLVLQEKCEDALDILKRVLQKRKEIFGLNNPSTLDIQNRIATAVYKQRKFHEALNMDNEIYDRQKYILGVNHKYTLRTKSSIGLVLHRLGDNEKAIDFYEEVVNKQIETLGNSHKDTLDTKLHMALVLDSLGRHDEALKYNQEVYNMSMVRGDVLMSLASQNNIALVLGHQKKYEDAIKTYRDVYDKKKRVLGPHHSDTLRTLHNIGTVLFESKKLDDALKSFTDVYEIQKSYLGPCHLDTLQTQTNIAEVLLRQGKMYAAYKNYKQHYNQSKAILGENHPAVLNACIKMDVITKVAEFKNHNISEIIDDDAILYTAVDNQNAELVKDILSSGIDINMKDGEGRTALHYAANTGSVRVLRILLENGANVFQSSIKGNTPLHTAASKGHREVTVNLLQHVKKSYPHRVSNLVDAKTLVGGTTALHICAQKNNNELVVLLLQYGACYNIKNAQHKTPLQLTTIGSTTEIFLSYVDRFFLTVQLGEKNSVECFIKDQYFQAESLRKAVLYARDSNGKTLLQIAKRELAQLLLQKLKSP